MNDGRSFTNSTLSKDINTLGSLLGVIIREQEGAAAFDLVEEIRLVSKARRSGDPVAAQTLADRVDTIPLDAKNVLIKAFSNYFQLINIAEDLQRIRVIRQREAVGTLRESIINAIKTLRENGKSAEQMRSLLNQTRLRLVLTAHPSEAKRQEILIKLRHIAQMMEARDRQPPAATRTVTTWNPIWRNKLKSCGRRVPFAPPASKSQTKWISASISSGP